jgi:hypothetical protein
MNFLKGVKLTGALIELSDVKGFGVLPSMLERVEIEGRQNY